MSAPLLWIVFPAAASLILYIIRRWEKIICLAGAFFALLLAWLAWQLPVGEPIALRLWAGMPALRIGSSIDLFGNRLVLDNPRLPAIVIIYLSIFYWSIGAYVARCSRLFVPFGLGGAALVTAMLAIQPGAYAAPLLTLFALMSIPVLSAPGQPVGNGVFRMITNQIIGMCLLLFGEWSLLAATNVPLELAPGQSPNLVPSALLMALGIALLVSAFPFHTWIPMVARHTNPYSAAFVFFLLPAAVTFIILATVDRLRLLEISPLMYTTLRYGGAGMILVGGAFAALEKHLGRILGFAAIAQSGMILLAISLHEQGGSTAALAGVYFIQLIVQGISLALWAQALCAVRADTDELSFHAVQGFARRSPLVAACVVLTNLSLAGLPLLANFPVDLALWAAVAQNHVVIALVSFLGKALLLIAAIRTLAVLTTATSPAEPWRAPDRSFQSLLLVAGCILLILAGLFPNSYFPILTNMAITFTNPVP